MIVYILKFSAILIILLVFYKLALESSSLHKLKRFYLLGAVLIFLTFPLITFNHYVEIPAISNEITLINPEIEVGSQEILVNNDTQITDYLPQILWTLYLIGFIVFSIRFANNLKEVYDRVKLNPQIRDKNFINVLLIDLFVPHTFFNYIFLDKDLFINKKIPKEVFIHEQAHARQLHSLDILIVELLQVILWFNPLILLLKKQIKINHEFLADQAVLNKGICTKSYQNLLLEFSSHSYSPTIANAINYSSTRNTLGVIKKRFTVMKTKTSKKAMCIKSILILPLLGLLLYGFSETKEVNIYKDEPTHSTTHTARSIEIEILENDLFLIDGIVTDKVSFISTLNSLHQDITTDIRNDIINIHVKSKNNIKDEDVWFIYNSSFDYGFYRLVTDKQEVIKAKGNTPFGIETNDFKLNSDTIDYGKSGSIFQDKPLNKALKESTDKINVNYQEPLNVQDGASKSEITEYNTWAKAINKQISQAEKNEGNKKWNAYPIVKVKDVEKYKAIYNRMSKTQRNNAEPWPNFPPPPPPPQVPTETPDQNKRVIVPIEIDIMKDNSITLNESKIEYVDLIPTILVVNNHLSVDEKRKYLHFSIRVESNESLELANEIQSKLIKAQIFQGSISSNQKPETSGLSSKHSSPNAGLTLTEAKLKAQEDTEKYDTKLKNNDTLIKSPWSLKNVKSVETFEEQAIDSINPPPPPPPPKPEDPIDHIIRMAKKNAAFYYEGKPIDSDKATDILKKNKKLNIQIREEDSDKPIVLITKSPIFLKKKS